MSDFREIDIRRLDGGLLLVFRELLRRGSARETGIELGLSQPAVSHALARLRDLFGDPLFIRRSHGLEPTRRALELGPRIEALIELAGAAIARNPGFEPARSDRIFTIGGYDSVLLPIAPMLLQAVAREAPDVTIRFVDMLYWQAADALVRGEIDLAIGRIGDLPPGLQSETLFEEKYCVVGRKGHPRARNGRLSKAAYVETGHVFVSHPARRMGDAWDAADATAIYGTLPDRKQVRTLAYVSRFTTAMMICATTDALADVPRSLAEPLAKRLNLELFDLPFAYPVTRIEIVRRASGDDPGVDWLWGQVRASSGPPAPTKLATKRGLQKRR